MTNEPQNAMDRYLQDSGEKLSNLASRINRAPSTLTRALGGERNPSLGLARDVERGTGGRVTASEFISICMNAASKTMRQESAA
jgi:hypothetical protein